MPMPHRRSSVFGLIAAVLALMAFGFGTMLDTVRAAPSDTGVWSLVNRLPFFPVHSHLLPTGKMMIWPGDGGVSGNDPRSWNPADQSVAALAKPGYDTFCSGHSFLADGALFVAGGHIQNSRGLSRTSTYNPFTNAWTNFPNMNAGRWYPTATVLTNGDVLVVSGDMDPTVGVNKLPQVFQVATGTWRNLTNAQLAQDLYPTMLLAPNGRVFNAGPTTTTRYLDTSGTGAWSFVANRVGGYRDYGSAVMYAPGKVLTMGGGLNPPQRTAEVIDLNQAAPSWRAVGSMQFARRQINATLLPDGTVLVTGGTSSPGFNDPTGAVHAAELWNPATETWTTLASSSGIPRVYHSTALLLPDGQVLSTGGNGYPDTEIFSPPYLFKGARPTISSAPPSVGYGQSFFVGTPDAASISKVTMLRLSSVTHAFNMSQYINPLNFSQATGGLSVTAPPNANVAPPGPYLLFILNGNGVPSVARIAQVGPPTNNPVPTLASIAPTSAAAGGPAFTLTVNGTNFINGSRVRWNGSDRTTTFVSSTQLTAAIPASDIAAAGTAQVTVFNPTPGGGTSAAQTFTITPPANNPVPTLASIAPTSAAAGGPAFTLTVNGTNFVNGSRVRWNGSDRTTTFVSATQLTAAIPASDIAAAGTAQVTVFNPTPGGGTSAARAFTINPGTRNDLTRLGSIIARVTAPQGGGSRNIEIIRDGVKPPVGSTDSLQQYDTWDGNNTAPDDWIGYQYSTTQNFDRVVFQEGKHFFDGGWFSVLTVQVRQAGTWVTVSNLTINPAYPGVNDAQNFETYTMDFSSISGDAIRIFGDPGGSADFISVGELEVFGPASGTPGDLTRLGSIIARVTAPQGGGSRNIEIIRDGIKPPVGSTDSLQQYDTWDGNNTAPDDWIGYQYSTTQNFDRVVFQEGKHFFDGGWFSVLTVQVRQAGTWVTVSNLTINPAYPGVNDAQNFETYTMDFSSISGDAIRIFGDPGGSADFISVGELEVFDR
jgi:hypothetical protein